MTKKKRDDKKNVTPATEPGPRYMLCGAWRHCFIITWIPGQARDDKKKARDDKKKARDDKRKARDDKSGLIQNLVL